MKKVSLFFRLFAVLFLLLLATQVARGQEQRECRMAVVSWKDAAVYTKESNLDPNQIDGLTVPTVSIGCVRVTEATVLVVFQFARDRPSSFVAIPKYSVIAIAPLVPVPESKKENEQ